MAAEKKYHGHSIVATLADNIACPGSATTEYTTSDYNFIAGTNSGLKIVVYANTAFEVVTGQALNFELMANTTADPTVGPITNGHVYLVHKTSADGGLAFDDGDLICSYVLDPELLGSNVYIRLACEVDTDESADYYSAFIVPVV